MAPGAQAFSYSSLGYRGIGGCPSASLWPQRAPRNEVPEHSPRGLSSGRSARLTHGSGASTHKECCEPWGARSARCVG
eukprot:7837410-Pyramimonas_sp.AAC.1